MRPMMMGTALAVSCLCAVLPATGRAADDIVTPLEPLVAQTIRPVMARYAIPGMAVGIVMNRHSAVFTYGVASKATGRPVTGATLFEIGSVSKTFTATLAAYAVLTGKMALSDMASQHLSWLQGSSFDHVSLLALGTHTSGGLPLQFPDSVTDGAQMMAYFRAWKPAYAPGTYRTYTNPGIGLLGQITANSLGGDFAALMQSTLYARLGLSNTYLTVPAARAEDYAQGYTAADVPVRMKPGVLAQEAYGVRTTAADLLRFVAANIDPASLQPAGPDDALQRAITATHTGYYRIGPMTQDLIWEQYPYPVSLPDLLAGNAPGMAYDATPATKLDPPLAPQDAVLINKTGSTSGFSAYVLFIPAQRLGLVLLANKSYPIDARVTAAYAILSRLTGDAAER